MPYRCLFRHFTNVTVSVLNSARKEIPRFGGNLSADGIQSEGSFSAQMNNARYPIAYIAGSKTCKQ